MPCFVSSAQKEEGGDGLKTLECLRGRLLSERVASKSANVEAENLGNKVCFSGNDWFRI